VAPGTVAEDAMLLETADLTVADHWAIVV